MNQPWTNEIDRIFTLLITNKNGLTQKDVAERIERDGANVLPRAKTFSVTKILLSQFASPLIYLLVFAGCVTIYLKDYIDATIIFIAVFLNTLVGFVQEYKASKALDDLKKVVKIRATVLRDGIKKEIPQEELVVGDIILFKAGDKIPADGRLLKAKNLKINQATLTGEWLADTKEIIVLKETTPLADRTNMVYMGTLVESGSGIAVVTTIGQKTEIGRVASLVRETEEEKTPYQKKLIGLGRSLLYVIGGTSLLVFVLGIITGKNFIEMFTTMVATFAAAIPEGLPIAITVVLALGTQRILKKQGLVKRLAAAESLGSVTVICVDKTGTLTEGKMEVSHIIGGQELIEENGIKTEENLKSHITVLEIAALCSEAYIENTTAEMEDLIIRGRSTDRALTLAAARAGVFSYNLLEGNPELDRLDFDSQYKFSASLNSMGDEHVLNVMGAPEKILEMCKFLQTNGNKEELDEAKINKIEVQFRTFTNKGLRVVAMAKKVVEEKSISFEKSFHQMTFIGLVALHDPLRPEVKSVIARSRTAGIRPVIVTGDHLLTAQAVAGELGFSISPATVMESQELAILSNEELRNRIKNISVFARVEPAQKLKIVNALQSLGEVVAMTGDGINDAPALKKADIGIALGSGTQVAKDVSDLVLLDDNFSVIVNAVEEGRGIVDNIRKTITYLLSDSLTEIILIGFSVIFGWPLPVLAGQILWVNLIEDGFPSIALALEPKEKDLMKRHPHPRDLPLLNLEMKTVILGIGLITNLILFGLFYYLLTFSGYEISHIRSVMFAGLTIGSLFYVFSCKSLSKQIWQTNLLNNKILIYTVFFGLLALISAIYIQPLQVLLRTEALNLYDWLLLLSLGMVNLFLIELIKFIFIKKRHYQTND